jgi:hypothetical protein
MRLVHVASDNENFAPCQDAVGPNKFGKYLHLDNSRHSPASSLKKIEPFSFIDHFEWRGSMLVGNRQLTAT